MRPGRALDPVEAAALGDQREQPELEREALLDRRAAGWLSALVIDHRKATVGEPIEPVDAAFQCHPRDVRLALALGQQRCAARGAVGGHGLGDPFDRLDQARRPQCAQHRVDIVAGEQGTRSRDQCRGIAIVVAIPLLEHLMDRGALPRRGGVGVDRVDRAQLEDGLGVESERIGLEAVEVGHCDLLRALVDTRSRSRLGDGLGRVAAVQGARDALQPDVARHPAGHRREPLPQSRGDRWRARIAPRPGQEHARGAERGGEIVRGKPDANVEPGQPEQAADTRRQPRIGARHRRPARLVEPAEHHHIGVLKPRFEQSPDTEPRVTAIGPPNRLGFEQLAQQRDPRARLDPEVGGGGRLFERFEQGGGGAALGTGPGRGSGDGIGGNAQGGGEARKRGGRGERRGRGVDSRADRRPGRGTLVGELLVEPVQSGARARTAQAAVEHAHVAEPIGPLVTLPADTRMLEQGEQGDRGKLLLGQRDQRQQQCSRRGLRQRPPGAVVGGDPPPRQLRRDTGGKRAVGGYQSGGLPGDFERLAQRQRDRLRFGSGIGELDAADPGEAALAGGQFAPFVGKFGGGERVGDGAATNRWRGRAPAPAPIGHFAARDPDRVEQALQMELRVAFLAAPIVGRAECVPLMVGHGVGKRETGEHDRSFRHSRDPGEHGGNRGRIGGDPDGDREAGWRGGPPALGETAQEAVAALGKVDQAERGEPPGPLLDHRFEPRQRALPVNREIAGLEPGLAQSPGGNLGDVERIEGARKLGREPHRLGAAFGRAAQHLGEQQLALERLDRGGNVGAGVEQVERFA